MRFKTIVIMAAISVLMFTANGWAGKTHLDSVETQGTDYDGYNFRGNNSAGTSTFSVDKDGNISLLGWNALYRTRKVIVNNFNQLTALGSASVYQVDLTKGTDIHIDIRAIYLSATPTWRYGTTAVMSPFSGLTVVGVMPTASNDGHLYTITKTDDSSTPWSLWPPFTDSTGVTRACNLYSTFYYASGGTPVTGASMWTGSKSGVSDYGGVSQFNRRTYQGNYNVGVSIVPFLPPMHYGP